MEEENSNVDQVCATENTVQWDELNVNPTTLSADFQSARDNTPDLERAPWMSKAQVLQETANAVAVSTQFSAQGTGGLLNTAQVFAEQDGLSDLMPDSFDAGLDDDALHNALRTIQDSENGGELFPFSLAGDLGLDHPSAYDHLSLPLPHADFSQASGSSEPPCGAVSSTHGNDNAAEAGGRPRRSRRAAARASLKRDHDNDGGDCDDDEQPTATSAVGGASADVKETRRGRGRGGSASKDTAAGRRHKSQQAADTVKEEDSSSEESESDSDSDDPDQLWCICSKPHGNRFMIACDKCAEWYHGKCVDVTKARGRQIEKRGEDWICPVCSGRSPMTPAQQARLDAVAAQNNASAKTEELDQSHAEDENSTTPAAARRTRSRPTAQQQQPSPRKTSTPTAPLKSRGGGKAASQAANASPSSSSRAAASGRGRKSAPSPSSRTLTSTTGKQTKNTKAGGTATKTTPGGKRRSAAVSVETVQTSDDSSNSSDSSSSSSSSSNEDSNAPSSAAEDPDAPTSDDSEADPDAKISSNASSSDSDAIEGDCDVDEEEDGVGKQPRRRIAGGDDSEFSSPSDSDNSAAHAGEEGDDHSADKDFVVGDSGKQKRKRASLSTKDGTERKRRKPATGGSAAERSPVGAKTGKKKPARKPSEKAAGKKSSDKQIPSSGDDAAAKSGCEDVTCVNRDCNKVAMTGSVYCSKDCLIRHAREALKTLQVQETKQRKSKKATTAMLSADISSSSQQPPPPRSGAATTAESADSRSGGGGPIGGNVDLSSTAHSSSGGDAGATATSSAGSSLPTSSGSRGSAVAAGARSSSVGVSGTGGSGAGGGDRGSRVPRVTPAFRREQRLSERVTVVDRITGAVLTGVAAPTRAELDQWLATHPSFEVVRGESSSTSASSSSRHPDISSASSGRRRDTADGHREHSRRERENREHSRAGVGTSSMSAGVAGPGGRRDSSGGLLSPTGGDPDYHRPGSSPRQGGGGGDGSRLNRSSSPPGNNTAGGSGRFSPSHGGESARDAARKKAETLRRNVFISIKDILVDRCRAAPELKVTDGTIQRRAQRVEEALFALRDDTKHYRSAYGRVAQQLKTPKNPGLFRQVITGYLRAKDLVRMSPVELTADSVISWQPPSQESSEPADSSGPLSILDTTSQHGTHLFDINCTVCRQERDNENESQEGQGTPDNDIDGTPMEDTDDTRAASSSAASAAGGVDMGQGAGIVKLLLKTPDPKTDPEGYSQYVDSLCDSTDDGGAGAGGSTASDVPPSPDSASQSQYKSNRICTWKGYVTMTNLTKFASRAYLVSGPPDHLMSLLPDTVHLTGRSSPSDLYAYLTQLKKSTTRDVCIVYLEPTTDDERPAYQSLYTYLYQRRRCGVCRGVKPPIRDLYLLPLSASDILSPAMLPFDGPGLPHDVTEVLAAVIVRSKVKRKSSSASSAAAGAGATATSTTAKGGSSGKRHRPEPAASCKDSKPAIALLTNEDVKSLSVAHLLDYVSATLLPSSSSSNSDNNNSSSSSNSATLVPESYASDADKEKATKQLQAIVQSLTAHRQEMQRSEDEQRVSFATTLQQLRAELEQHAAECERERREDEQRMRRLSSGRSTEVEVGTCSDGDGEQEASSAWPAPAEDITSLPDISLPKKEELAAKARQAEETRQQHTRQLTERIELAEASHAAQSLTSKEQQKTLCAVLGKVTERLQLVQRVAVVVVVAPSPEISSMRNEVEMEVDDDDDDDDDHPHIAAEYGVNDISDSAVQMNTTTAAAGAMAGVGLASSVDSQAVPPPMLTTTGTAGWTTAAAATTATNAAAAVAVRDRSSVENASPRHDHVSPMRHPDHLQHPRAPASVSASVAHQHDSGQQRNRSGAHDMSVIDYGHQRPAMRSPADEHHHPRGAARIDAPADRSSDYRPPSSSSSMFPSSSRDAFDKRGAGGGTFNVEDVFDSRHRSSAMRAAVTTDTAHSSSRRDHESDWPPRAAAVDLSSRRPAAARGDAGSSSSPYERDTGYHSSAAARGMESGDAPYEPGDMDTPYDPADVSFVTSPAPSPGPGPDTSPPPPHAAVPSFAPSPQHPHGNAANKTSGCSTTDLSTERNFLDVDRASSSRASSQPQPLAAASAQRNADIRPPPIGAGHTQLMQPPPQHQQPDSLESEVPEPVAANLLSAHGQDGYSMHGWSSSQKRPEEADHHHHRQGHRHHAPDLRSPSLAAGASDRRRGSSMPGHFVDSHFAERRTSDASVATGPGAAASSAHGNDPRHPGHTTMMTEQDSLRTTDSDFPSHRRDNGAPGGQHSGSTARAHSPSAVELATQRIFASGNRFSGTTTAVHPTEQQRHAHSGDSPASVYQSPRAPPPKAAGIAALKSPPTQQQQHHHHQQQQPPPLANQHEPQAPTPSEAHHHHQQQQQQHARPAADQVTQALSAWRSETEQSGMTSVRHGGGNRGESPMTSSLTPADSSSGNASGYNSPRRDGMAGRKALLMSPPPTHTSPALSSSPSLAGTSPLICNKPAMTPERRSVADGFRSPLLGSNDSQAQQSAGEHTAAADGTAATTPGHRPWIQPGLAEQHQQQQQQQQQQSPQLPPPHTAGSHGPRAPPPGGHNAALAVGGGGGFGPHLQQQQQQHGPHGSNVPLGPQFSTPPPPVHAAQHQQRQRSEPFSPPDPRSQRPAAPTPVGSWQQQQQQQQQQEHIGHHENMRQDFPAGLPPPPGPRPRHQEQHDYQPQDGAPGHRGRFAPPGFHPGQQHEEYARPQYDQGHAGGGWRDHEGFAPNPPNDSREQLHHPHHAPPGRGHPGRGRNAHKHGRYPRGGRGYRGH